MLNTLRREALEALTTARRERHPRRITPFLPNDAPYPARRLDFRANVLNGHARRFYERHGAEVTEGAFEALPVVTGRVVMTCRYCIRHQLDLCPRKGGPGGLVDEPLRITDGHHSYRLEFDCGQCMMRVILEGR